MSNFSLGLNLRIALLKIFILMLVQIKSMSRCVKFQFRFTSHCSFKASICLFKLLFVFLSFYLSFKASICLLNLLLVLHLPTEPI